MSRRGANWYPREPHAYLGGVRGLPSKLHAVYSVILDLIYDGGGECPNDPKWISGWFSDLGPASVRRAISNLCDMGKLAVESNSLTNKRATIEAKTDRETREKRGESGRKGGRISGERRARKSVTTQDNNDLGEPSASTKNEPEKSTVEKIKRDTNVSPKKATRLPDDWLLPKPWREWALEQGLPPERVRREALKFRNYWTAKAGKDAAKLNWQRTWENWCLTALERNRGKADDKFARKMEMAKHLHERREGDSSVDNGAGGGDTFALLPARHNG